MGIDDNILKLVNRGGSRSGKGTYSIINLITMGTPKKSAAKQAVKKKDDRKSLLNLSKEQRIIQALISSVNKMYSNKTHNQATPEEAESAEYQEWEAAYDEAVEYMDGLKIPYEKQREQEEEDPAEQEVAD